MDNRDKSGKSFNLSTNKDNPGNNSGLLQNSAQHVVHDINNILTRILNSVELIKKKIPENTEIIPLLNSIENGTYLAAEIMEDVVSESKNIFPPKRKVNLNSLINDLVNSVGIHLFERIEFELKFDNDIQYVEGRYTDYYRIIMNLIINASEAIKDKGRITITTYNTAKNIPDQKEISLFETGKFIEIKVKDNGAGIEKSNLPHIFDNTFSTKTKKKNSGYGLAIVKEIVEANNGSIFVKSEMNKGTEFTLSFPSVDMKSNPLTGRNKSILIAEDEEIQRMLLTELLESYHYKTSSVPNGKILIEELSKHKYDLVIIDRQIPDIDGITCINMIKEMKLEVPIILATGSQSMDLDIEQIKSTAYKLISKPYNFDEMLNLIRALVG